MTDVVARTEEGNGTDRPARRKEYAEKRYMSAHYRPLPPQNHYKNRLKSIRYTQNRGYPRVRPFLRSLFARKRLTLDLR